MHPLVAALIGFVVGIVVAIIIHGLKGKLGVLKIDHSNPEKDVYRLEIGDLDKLNGKKHIVLKIDHDADLSQE